MIATGVAVLAVAMLASAQGYAFNTNLTVGSTGSDVVALQTWLISSGYSIPSIASGAAAKGYFGSQTKAAVVAYQTAKGIPSTGFVGPLTRAQLNGSPVATPVSSGCPVGYTCTLTAIAGATCPAGMTCTPVGTQVGSPVGISTPGVVGTLVVSLWSSPSGIVAYKGQAYDVASYKVQASASDMALQNLTLDFDVRLWLYASSVTIKDDTGAVVGQVSNLGANPNSSGIPTAFSELTVGSQYRLSVPVSNLVVKATQIKYLTVNISFLPSSDRGTGTVTVLQAQIRSVDGTGVTDTETSNAVGSGRTFSYQGSGAGSVIVTTDSSSPATGLVQLSTAVQTQGVTLGIFDIKSQNAPSTLRSISFIVRTAGTAKTPADLFGTYRIQIAGQTYSANSVTPNGSTGLAGSSTIAFTSLSIPLGADVYTSNALDGTAASTTLVAAGSVSGTSNNPSVEDSSYNTLAVNGATFTSNALTFTGSGLNASGLVTSYGTAINTTGGTSTQQFTFAFNLSAGNNPIYLSKTQATAISTSSLPSGMTINTVNWSDNDTSGDGSTYFYLSPGQTKTFSAIYSASGLTSNGGTFNVNSINFGTTSTSAATMTVGALTSSDVTNLLKAVLYH